MPLESPTSRRGTPGGQTGRGCAAVHVSITGFGVGGRHEQRTGHESITRLGGVLEDTAGARRFDRGLAAGALGAVTETPSPPVAREDRSGAHIVVR